MDIFSFIKLINFRKFAENNRIKNVILSGLSNFSVKAISIIVNLVSVPLTLNYLGKEKFGVWLTITSTVSLLNFLDFGLGSGLVNQISESQGKGNPNNAKKAVSTTFLVLIFISTIIGCVFYFFNEFWLNNVYVSLSFDQKSEVKDAINLLMIFILLNIPLGVIQRIYDGLQQGFKFTSISLIGILLNLILIMITIHCKGNLEYLVLSINLGTLISVLVAGFLLIKKNNYLSPSVIYFEVTLISQILKQGFLFFLMTIFTIAAYTTDNFIIADKLDFSQVTKFDLTKKIFSASALAQFFIIPLWPMFNEAMAAGNYLWSKKMLTIISTIALVSSVIFSFPLLIWGNEVLYFWTKQNQNISFGLLLGFYFFILISTIGGVISSFFNGKEFLKVNTILIMCTSICSVMIKLLFVEKLGLNTMIWATVLSYTLLYIIPSFFIIRNYFKKATASLSNC
jgi:O-antigen/teichoic acid export membrane protein